MPGFGHGEHPDAVDPQDRGEALELRDGVLVGTLSGGRVWDRLQAHAGAG